MKANGTFFIEENNQIVEKNVEINDAYYYTHSGMPDGELNDILVIETPEGKFSLFTTNTEAADALYKLRQNGVISFGTGLYGNNLFRVYDAETDLFANERKKLYFYRKDETPNMPAFEKKAIFEKSKAAQKELPSSEEYAKIIPATKQLQTAKEVFAEIEALEKKKKELRYTLKELMKKEAIEALKENGIPCGSLVVFKGETLYKIPDKVLSKSYGNASNAEKKTFLGEIALISGISVKNPLCVQFRYVNKQATAQKKYIARERLVLELNLPSEEAGNLTEYIRDNIKPLFERTLHSENR